MLHLIITILVGLTAVGFAQRHDNKDQEHFAPISEDDGTKSKTPKGSTECGNIGWQDNMDVEKRAWNNMQVAWGKRKWQDMQSPGWGKRRPASEFDTDMLSHQMNFQDDKRGWRDIQGASWGKRGWQDMRQPSWGKRGWQDMRGNWGKRGWQDMQGLNWGKRGWQDLRNSWGGKRGWQDMQGLNWGKRRWQDMQTSSWGKRGWKELQTSGWGKRDGSDDQGLNKRGWGDMKMSGYGKRAWNDIQTAGWGKRGWKEMRSAGWGKRTPQDYVDSVDDDDWEQVKSDPLTASDAEVASERPVGQLVDSSRNDWRLYLPIDEQTLVDKLLEGMNKSSWGNHGFKLRSKYI